MSKTHKVTEVSRTDKAGRVTWYLRWKVGRKYKERRASDHAGERARERKRLQARLNASGNAVPLEAAWLDHQQDLEPRTVTQYLRALRRFIEATGCTHTWDVHRQSLRDYRTHLADLDLAPGTKNSHINRLAAILHQLRRSDLTPDLHRDDITDTLRRFKVRKEPPQPYTARFLHMLFQGVTKHDLAAARPARPLIEFALLSGLRRSELFALTEVGLTTIASDCGEADSRGKPLDTGHGRQTASED